MAHQIIKSPDGKYNIWSTIIDDFVATGGNRQDIIDFYRTRYLKEVEGKIKDLESDLDQIDNGNAKQVYFQFAMTYKAAIKERNSVHGKSKGK